MMFYPACRRRLLLALFAGLPAFVACSIYCSIDLRLAAQESPQLTSGETMSLGAPLTVPSGVTETAAHDLVQPQSASRRQAPARRKASPALLVQPQTSVPSEHLSILEAHQVATRASTESQYTSIIDLCEEAAVAPLDAEIAAYAHRLAAWAYNRRGELKADSGADTEALADFEAAVQHDPARWKAVHNRGVSYAHAGKLKNAFDDFCRTIQLHPKHAKAFSNRGALYEQAGDTSAALADYRTAIEIDPQLAAAHAGRGRVSQLIGDFEVANHELAEAVRLAPDNATLYMARGDLYAELGRYEAALSNYGKAIKLNPLLAEAYRNGAWLLATCPDDQFRDDVNAIEGAEKALELAGDARHLYLDTLAAAHASAGDFEEAVRTAELAVDEAPPAFRGHYVTRLKMYEQGQAYRTMSSAR